MDYEKKIEIPFGAHDSELKGWEYTIPEGFTAEIKGGKVIVREKESEDERIMEWMINQLSAVINTESAKEFDPTGYEMAIKALSWLEKQKKSLHIPETCKENADSFTSEDERIRKSLVDYFRRYNPKDKWDEEFSFKDVLSYLEKQKINTEGDFGRGYDCGYEACLNSHGTEWFEKQKEQKPAEWSEKDKEMYKLLRSVIHGTYVIQLQETQDELLSWLKSIIENFVSRPKQEWREEDEERIQSILFSIGYCKDEYPNKKDYSKDIDWLKSLRPQPREEIYQSAKHDLAITFMTYLDVNRPEGKMILSNGECEDIDKAFKEYDWAKILRYAEKYGKEN